MKGHEVAGVDYRIVPLADYEPDILYQKQVEAYYATLPFMLSWLHHKSSHCAPSAKYPVWS